MFYLYFIKLFAECLIKSEQSEVLKYLGWLVFFLPTFGTKKTAKKKLTENFNFNFATTACKHIWDV
jgi:hypothetical protein